MSTGGSNLLSWPTQEGWRADYWSTPSGAELELCSLRADEAPRFCALLLSCVPRKQDNSPPPGGPRRFSIKSIKNLTTQQTRKRMWHGDEKKKTYSDKKHRESLKSRNPIGITVLTHCSVKHEMLLEICRSRGYRVLDSINSSLQN